MQTQEVYVSQGLGKVTSEDPAGSPGRELPLFGWADHAFHPNIIQLVKFISEVTSTWTLLSSVPDFAVM